MKRNRIAIILVIILGSASFWYIVNNRKSTLNAEMRNFAVADTASITKIFLADKEGRTITLERHPEGNWTVNQKYAVRMDALQTLLETIKRVDVKEPVGKKAQDNVIKRLAAKAVKCEIYQNDVLTKAYYVGTETQDNTGTFMIKIDPETMKTAEKPFVTYIPGFEGYLTTRYFTEEQGWRDRTVFKYNPLDIKSVKMETPLSPEKGYELIVKGNNDYQVNSLADNKPLEGIDPIAVKQYLSYFQILSFESFEVDLNQKQIDSVLKCQPINIITVTDNKGNTNKVKFYARAPKKGALDVTGKPLQFDPERMDALMNNGKDFVMLQYFTFGKVMPPATYFQKGKEQTIVPVNKPPTKPKA
ncbi:MAG: hypothetical protein ACXVPY_04505 [Bacteroidia bacterium]